MPVLSYVYELFNVDQCQAYIHTLRWKDRPLQCPRCQSHDVDPWGTYHDRPGCKRYWCNGCQRTFKARAFNIVIAGRAAGTPTHISHSGIRRLPAVSLRDRVKVGRGNLYAHVERAGPKGVRSVLALSAVW